ncbi:MAG: dipeptide ABC transporter ATP-binding protein [Clostridiales bacterium]|nr:dipeptide ABC transporter ATP-binding protein [Clostridiales bacterium]
MAAEILAVKGLKKYFPFKKDWFGRSIEYVRAVDGIDFHIGYGETLGLVGESGCGKSTTGRTIMRLLEPTEGEILFEGQNITLLGKKQLRQVYKGMQLIFQDPFASLNPRKTIGDALEEVLFIHGMKNSGQRRERTEELLEMVGIRKEEMDKYPHEFSGGQRQRIVIARALAVNPRLIICDEPVSALDVSIQAQIINLLMELKNRLKLAYMFISHDLRVVRHVSDRMAVMYLGKIVETAPAEELFEEPAHPYTKALLSVVPHIKPGHRRKKTILEGEVPSPVNPPSGCRFRTRCRYATEQCAESEPPLKCLGRQHYVACHLY